MAVRTKNLAFSNLFLNSSYTVHVFVWGDKPWKDFIKPEPEKFTGLLDHRRYNYMSPDEWKNSLLSLGEEEADKPD